jgi:hypothetical protein
MKISPKSRSRSRFKFFPNATPDTPCARLRASPKMDEKSASGKLIHREALNQGAQKGPIGDTRC